MQVKERTDCYERLAKVLNVDPLYEAIGHALENQLNKVLISGMNRKEVDSILSKNSAVKILDYSLLNYGKSLEEITLNECKYPENNFIFGIIFSPDDKIEEVVWYMED